MTQASASPSPATATAPRISLVVEQVRSLRFDAAQAPYEVSGRGSSLNYHLSGGSAVSRLPEDGHWRLTLEAVLGAKDTEGNPAFDGVCRIEGIVVVEGFESQSDVERALNAHILPLLLATARERLQSVSSSTGYPLIQMPILTAEEFIRFSKSAPKSAQSPQG